MLAFVEAFWVMGVVFLLMLPFLPLLQYSKPKRVTKPAPQLQKIAAEPGASLDRRDSGENEISEEERHEEEHHLVLH